MMQAASQAADAEFLKVFPSVMMKERRIKRLRIPFSPKQMRRYDVADRGGRISTVDPVPVAAAGPLSCRPCPVGARRGA